MELDSVKKLWGEGKYFASIMQFLLGTPVGILIFFAIFAIVVYFPAPVISHTVLFQFLILHWPKEVLVLVGLVVGANLGKRYSAPYKGKSAWKWGAISLGFYAFSLVIPGILAIVFEGVIETQIYKDAEFAEVDELRMPSIDQVRYTPHQVAGEEIVRRTQTSEFSPGRARAIGSETGVAYIAPLVPQGFINTLNQKNEGFLYFEDGGDGDDIQRVTTLTTDPFKWGEGMEIFDDIRRRLIKEIGFFKTYPEIYYAPVTNADGELEEVIGVVPYLSYRFHWGLLIPQWGGVAIFHANGKGLENLSPEEAQKDPRLIVTKRLFPEDLARMYVHAQRYDGKGVEGVVPDWFPEFGKQIVSGWIMRPGKIQIPKLPGHVQMPFFLPMEDETYQYLTTVEPDGDAYSLMRIYYVDAFSGELTMYRFDREGRKANLQGPAKILSYAKNIDGYNWYEEDAGGASGSYRLVEPFPAARRCDETFYWKFTITPIDFAGVMGTVFLDAETNKVHGPYKTREEAHAWLNCSSSLNASEEAGSVTSDESARKLSEICEQADAMQALFSQVCPSE